VLARRSFHPHASGPWRLDGNNADADIRSLLRGAPLLRPLRLPWRRPFDDLEKGAFFSQDEALRLRPLEVLPSFDVLF
jgi:hypothetical protein